MPPQRFADSSTCRVTLALKSDGEPTCVALKASIKAYRAKLGLRTHLEQPHAGTMKVCQMNRPSKVFGKLAGTVLGTKRWQGSPCHPCILFMVGHGAMQDGFNNDT